jgi:hypothetical protein
MLTHGRPNGSGEESEKGEIARTCEASQRVSICINYLVEPLATKLTEQCFFLRLHGLHFLLEDSIKYFVINVHTVRLLELCRLS